MLLRCCQCVRLPREDTDSRDSDGSRRDGRLPVTLWQDGCADDATSPPGYMLPLPSNLLQPTSGISMEPMAVRGSRSWPYVARTALVPLRPLPPRPAPSLMGSLTSHALPMPDALTPPVMHSSVFQPLRGLQLPVERGQGPDLGRAACTQLNCEAFSMHSEQEARELLRTMLSPARQKDSGRPSPRAVLARSPTASSTPRGASAPPTTRHLHPVPLATARIGMFTADSCSPSTGAYLNQTRRTIPQAGLPSATVAIDANPNGQVDYLCTGIGMTRDRIPDTLQPKEAVPRQSTQQFLNVQKLEEAQHMLKGMLSPPKDLLGATMPRAPTTPPASSPRTTALGSPPLFPVSAIMPRSHSVPPAAARPAAPV